MADKIEKIFKATESKRLLIRPVCMEDVEAIFEIFSNDVLMEPYGMHGLTSLEKSKEFTKGLIEDGELAILNKKDQSLIGTMGFLAYSQYNNRAEIAYELLEDYWGKGIMSEALDVLLSYGFSELCLHRIEAYVHPTNQASQKLLLKKNFKKEGLLKGRSYQRGEYRDAVLYALVKDAF